MNGYYVAHGSGGRVMFITVLFAGQDSGNARRSSFFAQLASGEKGSYRFEYMPSLAVKSASDPQGQALRANIDETSLVPLINEQVRKKNEEMNGSTLSALSPGALTGAERSAGERSEPQRSEAAGPRGESLHVVAGSTLNKLSVNRHNDSGKFEVVGVNEDVPIYQTDLDFFGV